jgi:hypothetical protein
LKSYGETLWPLPKTSDEQGIRWIVGETKTASWLPLCGNSEMAAESPNHGFIAAWVGEGWYWIAALPGSGEVQEIRR